MAELREKIETIMKLAFNSHPNSPFWNNVATETADQILALIPEQAPEGLLEATIQIRCEEAKKQERERIKKLYEDMGCVPESDNLHYDFWQALKEENKKEGNDGKDKG